MVSFTVHNYVFDGEVDSGDIFNVRARLLTSLIFV